MGSFSVALSGLDTSSVALSVIANNLANMNTVGYKRQRAEFQDLLYQDMEQVGSQSDASGTIVPTGLQIGSGVKAGSIYRITQQGSMTQTSNPLDLAIQGNGFLPVTTVTGDIAYTRAGSLQLDGTGR